MKALNFAKRNFKEIFRDPISLIFTFLLPLFLLWIFQQFKIPGEQYVLKNFTPAIIIFSYAFVSLFTGALVAKDRASSLIVRLCASPMKTRDYIWGYILAVLPLVLIQNILFFGVAIALGLEFNINIIYTIVATIPISIFFICLGIIVGCIANEKSAGPIGSIIVQLVAFTSGMYFSNEIVGKFFATICNILPFSHCVDLTRDIINNSNNDLILHFSIIVGYLIFTVSMACLLFNYKLKSDNK